METEEISADVLTRAEGGDWRSNMGATLPPEYDTLFYLGGYDLGDSIKLDLQIGKQ